VIGAGLGGLCCAVELARQGVEVLVLEQHHTPGGYAHGFERKGFRFDASLHHIGGLDEGALNRGVLTALGVIDTLELTRREHLLRVELPGLDLTLPNDPGALLQVLSERFPDQADGLWGFFGALRGLKGHTTGPVADPDFDLPPAERLSVAWADRTIGALIDEYIDDPSLKAVLGSPWVYLGLPPDRAAATFGACVLGSTWLEGAWQLRGGGAALSRALVERLEELGGRCVTKAAVARILVEDRKVAGVQLADGRRVASPVVISNADPHQTCRELLPAGSLPNPWLARLESMEPSASFLALYLGLDCPPSAIGIDEDEHFVLQHSDAETAWQALQAAELERTDWSIASFERADPDSAPSGGGTVTVMELTPASGWLGLDRAAYKARKAAVKERLLAKVEARFPGLREHIVVAELATPHTMQRYTRNHQGAVYGLAQHPHQAGRRRLGNRLPLPGLFLTGAWTWAGGGYEGALMSGLQSADAVLLKHPAPNPAPRGRLAAPPEQLPPLPSPASTTAAYPQRLEVRPGREARDHRGAVRPTALLRYLDRGRVEACERTCSATEQASWLERYLVNVYRIDARFPTAGARGALEVQTGLRAISSHRASFDQRVVDSDGRPVVVAGVEVTFLDPEDGLAPVPPGFVEGPAPAGAPARGLPPIPFSAKDHHPHRHPARVYYEDTDAQGIVYHVTYLRWCEEALEALLGDEIDAMDIDALDIRYLEAARFGDHLVLWVGARPLEGGAIAVDLRMVRERDETVVADATLSVSFGGQPAPGALQALVVDG